MNVIFPLILVSAMATSAHSVADSPPTFSVAPGCKAAAALNRSIDPALARGFVSCMTDEETARARLTEGWTTYPADARTHCVEQATGDGNPSYVEVLECLHLALGIEPPTPTLQGANMRTRKSQ
jgi:hypothetical protein